MASSTADVCCRGDGLEYGAQGVVQLGAVGQALGGISWLWAVSYIGSLQLSWTQVKHKSSVKLWP